MILQLWTFAKQNSCDENMQWNWTISTNQHDVEIFVDEKTKIALLD